MSHRRTAAEPKSTPSSNVSTTAGGLLGTEEDEYKYHERSSVCVWVYVCVFICVLHVREECGSEARWFFPYQHHINPQHICVVLCCSLPDVFFIIINIIIITASSFPRGGCLLVLELITVDSPLLFLSSALLSSPCSLRTNESSTSLPGVDII